MFRVVFIGLALAAFGLAAAPGASACCHLIYDHRDVGPCYLEWAGNLVFGSENYFEYVTVQCSAAGQTVGHTVEDVCLPTCP